MEMDALVRELEEREVASPSASTRSKKRIAADSPSEGEAVKKKKAKKKTNNKKGKVLPTQKTRGTANEGVGPSPIRPMPPLTASPDPTTAPPHASPVPPAASLMQQPMMESPPGNPVVPGGSPTVNPFSNTPGVAAGAAPVAVQTVNESPAESTRSSKKAADPITTARHKKKNKQGQVQIKKGGRVKIKRKNIYHLLTKQSQKDSLKGYSDNYNCYGKIISGSSQAGYNVSFDIFNFEDKIVFVKRKWLTAVTADAKDEYDRVNDDPEHLDEIAAKETDEKKNTPFKKCWKAFIGLDDSLRAEAKTFEMILNSPGDSINWDILPDGQHITRDEDPMEYPTEVRRKKDIDFGDDGNTDKYADIFFEHFFPDVTGHAQKMDTYLSNIKAPMYQTVLNDGIKFHDAEADDNDWIIKQAYLLILAAATESDVGVENLWKRGKSGGRHDHADFGQYMPQNWFKAFQSAAALMFCAEEHWFLDKRDKPWDIFVPALDGFNMKRKDLFYTVLSMLDESMSGWRPKTSKHGGLPNITFEPRKPVPLGTMLRNCVECITGAMVYQDIVMHPEMQQRKEFYYQNVQTQVREPTSLPGSPPMPAHSAEVLRLCKGAGMDPGGWTGGDAWFGSVTTAVELRKRLGIFSTFVVKKQAQFFPKEVLHSILQARHGERPAGHWVVMRATIADVPVIAMAYAWSQKGVSYFVSTCGCTAPSEVKYESKYEDAWGNTAIKLIDRPELCHFLYEFLPLIDEHNKQRQALLALEKRWLTKSPWFRLICTILGQSTVDMHRYFRHESIRTHAKEHEMIDHIRVLNFSDKICGALRPWPRKAARPTLATTANRANGSLSRITNVEGTMTTYKVTERQRLKGKTVGNSITLVCFVCRGYLNSDDSSVYKPTSFWCSQCHMPLCSNDRRYDIKTFGAERDMTCIQIHQQSTDINGCNGQHPRGTEYPDDCKVSLHPRKSQRKR